MKNHYQSLGINRAASPDEIKKAYRKLAQKFHPDKNDGDKFFEDRFKEIQAAYEVLSNPYKKGGYDNEFDNFFNNKSSNYNKYSSYKEEPKYKEPPKTDPKKEQRQREENAKRERIKNIKRNAELSFEDKAWIFLGNWFIIPGAVGLWMFIKYRKDGYIKKSNSVCSLSIVSFIILFVLAILITIGRNA